LCPIMESVTVRDSGSRPGSSSAVNEIVAKRMVKKQQMRWNRHTVQSFLDVRIHVLNGTLENAFRHWHQGLRQSRNSDRSRPQRDHPTTLHALARSEER